LRKGGRLYEQDRFLYGEDEYAIFKAADVVWVGYEGQYVSSGVLLQAAMVGLPIVACDEGLIGWLTKSRELGIVVNTADMQAVAKTLSTLAQNPELAAKFGENGRQVSVRHGVDNFRREIREKVFSRRLSGSPQ
jgi:glycosyltransferase involved in cell wall biosynthesis